MNKLILALAMFAIVSATAFADTIVSDTTTEYYDGSSWASAALAWVHPSWPSITGANWIWNSYYVSANESYYGATYDFRRGFELPACATNITGTIDITCDNEFSVSVDGNSIGSGNAWNTIYHFDISSALTAGSNEFEFTATNLGNQQTNPQNNPGAFIYSASIDYDCEEPAVPEFGTVAALIALAGAATGFFVLRKQ